MAATVLSLLALSGSVLGHGYLQVPQSRNFIAYQNPASQFNCQHCLSGDTGGYQGAYEGGPRPNPGVCGGVEPRVDQWVYYDKSLFLSGGTFANGIIPTSNQFTAGQVATFNSAITTWHGGYVKFYLCPDNPKTEEELAACLASQPPLRRDPTDTKYSPYSPAFPHAFYLSPPDCMVAEMPTGLQIPMRFLIPSNISCKRCVLQWVYVTANSCNPQEMYGIPSLPIPNNPTCGKQRWYDTIPGIDCTCWTNYGDTSRFPIETSGPYRGTNAYLNKCGQSAQPEVFYNCADIQIRASASATFEAVQPTSTLTAIKPLPTPIKPFKPNGPKAHNCGRFTGAVRGFCLGPYSFATACVTCDPNSNTACDGVGGRCSGGATFHNYTTIAQYQDHNNWVDCNTICPPVKQRL